MSDNRKRNRSGDQPDSPSDEGSPLTQPEDSSPPLAFTPGTPGLFAPDDNIDSEVVQNFPGSEDEDGEDLFGSDAEDDYRENPELDRYDQEDLDEQEYDAMDIGQRRQVDQMLEAREQRINRNPTALLNAIDLSPVGPDRRRRRHLLMLNDYKDYDEDTDMDLTVTLEDLNDFKAGSISEWITMEGPRRAIRKQFKDFLTSTNEEAGRSIYVDRIRALGQGNKETLEISYSELVASSPVLAYILTNAPRAMFQILDSVAFELVVQMFSDYDTIHSEIHCRVTDLPTVCSLRDLRQVHLNCLVKVFGVVSRRSSVFPQLKYVKYKCGKCGVILGPFYQDPSALGEIKISNCSNCESKGPFIFQSEQTVYRNYQKITLQETPGTVPPGRLPRHREVILLWDLVDSVKPGEEIEVVGIYMNNLDVSLNNKYGFPVFSTLIEANHVVKRNQDTSIARLTEDDEKAIRELAKDPNIGKRIIHSIAPSIYGHLDIKTSIALSLFGGCSKDVNGKHHIRGDINVLLLGDPGTAKSQFLKYAEKTAHRCVYATGQGASAVGLTASVRKDPMTKEWTLEGGALVLADQGVCLIDEFDKMNEKDRTSIHEAMEQQSISISKAGIVTSLQARCSIIAAANPIRGRYNPTLPLTQNVDLTEPILSRFDLVCVVRDTVDPTLDFQLANFVLDSHDNSHPDSDTLPPAPSQVEGSIEPIPQELLRKYITFAREKCRPVLYSIDEDKVSKLYSELRKVSIEGGGLTITLRHLESIIRISEANARMHLRDQVRADDFDRAISTFLESFIQTQKISVMKALRKNFARYLYVGQDSYKLLTSLLGKLARESIQLYELQISNEEDQVDPEEELNLMPESIKIPVDEVAARARELSIFDIGPFIRSAHLKDLGYTVEEHIDPETQEATPYIVKALTSLD